MRVLVLTGSRVFPGLVDSLTPRDLQVDATNTFADALRQVEEDAPDGIIIDGSLCRRGLCEEIDSCFGESDSGPCGEIRRACRCHRPRIPVLVESAFYRQTEPAADDAGDHPTEVRTLPMLKADLEHLLEEIDTTLH